MKWPQSPTDAVMCCLVQNLFHSKHPESSKKKRFVSQRAGVPDEAAQPPRSERIPCGPKSFSNRAIPTPRVSVEMNKATPAITQVII